MMTYTKTFNDLWFTVEAEVCEYHVNFNIYDITGFAESRSGVYDAPRWHEKEPCEYPSTTDDLRDAEIYAQGYVKSDGCSNWRFNEQDRIMLHGCTRQNIQRFGDILASCWDWSAELLGDKWDGVKK